MSSYDTIITTFIFPTVQSNVDIHYFQNDRQVKMGNLYRKIAKEIGVTSR